MSRLGVSLVVRVVWYERSVLSCGTEGLCWSWRRHRAYFKRKSSSHIVDWTCCRLVGRQNRTGGRIRTHRRSHNRCCRRIHWRLVAASARHPSRRRDRLCDRQCHHWCRLTSARGWTTARWWPLWGRLGQTPMVVAREGDFEHRWSRVFTAAAFGIGFALSVCLEASAQPAPDYAALLSAPDRS